MVIEDRHFDPVIEVFTDCAAAIERAEAIIAEINEDYPVRSEYPKVENVDGYAYYANYSGEGDHAFVREAPLKADL